jgi:NAD(P)H dehydrogenase (quinone)
VGAQALKLIENNQERSRFMNIGIIIYSETGNTLSVAEKMKTTLDAAGHTAEIRRITIEKTGDSGTPVKLIDIPAIDGFDALIFGAPVQAFSLCRAMTLYLKQIPDIQGRPVACYITQGLPKKWMGGNRAYKTIRRLCMQRGAEPVQIGHIHWRSKERGEQIAGAVSGAVKFIATAG